MRIDTQFRNRYLQKQFIVTNPTQHFLQKTKHKVRHSPYLEHNEAQNNLKHDKRTTIITYFVR